MIDLERFKSILLDYDELLWDFAEFWKWKLRIETEDEHILDNKHREETHRRLSEILPGWKTYRPYTSLPCLRILNDSLQRISDAYNEVRSYSLLEFNRTPRKSLELIWHELGRAKEERGRKNLGGWYYIIAVCKPLMFLCGQTLAYDSRVRENVPSQYGISKSWQWTFEDWKMSMEKFQQNLKKSSKIIDLLDELSREKFGTDSTVPYGQFLDYYYWYRKKRH